MSREPVIFGVRHLSPAGAFHLRKLMDEVRPRLVLVEGPSDMNGRLDDLTRPETKPPVAILSYSRDTPVRTMLIPFAVYSPEYQAVLWAKENGAVCRFMDLPSDVFLAIENGAGHSSIGEEERFDVYRELDRKTGEDGHDTFWERHLEHDGTDGVYHKAVNAFGAGIRQVTEGREDDWAENLVREAFMRRQIEDGMKEGFEPEEILVVTGAYHVEGIKSAHPMSDEEVKALPRMASDQTFMPYSYYRLSTRSGYGAGNKAPAYYHMIWEAFCQGDLNLAARKYLSSIALWQREHGNPVSTAQVIEAVTLAQSLAALRGSEIPVLRDLRDSAVTCLGQGSFASISRAVADTEIGTLIGTLPEGVSRTSIQEDFYRQLRELKLEKYRDMTAQDLPLDLRENRQVKNEKSAFLDLNRSFFLHRLRVLGISFAREGAVRQDKATWSEPWVLQWSPEAEIELVESALKGDTVIQAASFALKERLEEDVSMQVVASVIEDAFTCGMTWELMTAAQALQSAAVDAVALDELGITAGRLSFVLQYGSIRRLEVSSLEPILQQLFYRACLIAANACVCDDAGAQVIIEAIGRLNSVGLAHEFLEEGPWLAALEEMAGRDDLNTRCSGYAAAVLLERGRMDEARLSAQVSRRLSRGIPADLGAGWFEGLAMKNRYALIARLSLWKSLSDYLDELDEEEFKRALVFLRRAFADFSSREKSDIAENLGEVWELAEEALRRQAVQAGEKEAQILKEVSLKQGKDKSVQPESDESMENQGEARQDMQEAEGCKGNRQAEEGMGDAKQEQAPKPEQILELEEFDFDDI